jgi:LuxR family maltose regulon positive regulatory protein
MTGSRPKESTARRRPKAAGGAAVAVHPEPSAQRPAGSKGSASAIIRHRLLDRLSDEPRPRLIVVQGPAGYGKTSLLRQHCERRAACGEHIAWVRMDAESGDATHFLRLLCDAVDGLLHAGGRKASSAQAGHVTTLQDLLRRLARVREPVVLVVDNFETAASSHFEAVFAKVVRSLPMAVQLCVGTRVLPTAFMARQQIRDGTVVVANEDLCFRPSETLEFFREFGDLRPEQVAEIHERTDGWPAALQAYRLCLRRGVRSRVEAYAGRGVTRELIDFLAAEMFENLASGQQTRLLELAVPEKLSAALVEHITGEARGAKSLTEIERAGLFLAQADLKGAWLRFHNLFRQFLLARAAATWSPQEMARRHRHIARWYEDQGLVEEAIGHWLDAGDAVRAARLFAGIVESLVAQERLGLIERYVDRLGVEAVLAHDLLVHAAVVAYGFRRSFDKAERLLERQQARLDSSDAPIGARNLHRVSRLFVLAARDRVEQLGAEAKETAEQMEDRGGAMHGVALNARAVYEVGRGDFNEARALMVRARPLHDRDRHAFGQGYQEAITSMTLTAQGRIGDALNGLGAALRRTEEQSAGSASAGSVIAAYFASAAYEQNDVAQAERLILDYGQLAEQQAIVDPAATMGITRARIALLQGRRGEAEEILERLIFLGYRHGLERLVIYAHAELARQATLDGDLGAAERWLRELPAAYRDADPPELMFYAGEDEACGVSYARWQIAAGRHAAVRDWLAAEIRRAVLARRRRRELKLRLLEARVHHDAGKGNVAGRSLLEALQIGVSGGFLRGFLDEGAPVLALLKELRARQRGVNREVQPDAVMSYLERLLEAAGDPEARPAPDQAAGPDASGRSELIGSLTEGERKLLHYMAAGLSNRQLADRLSVSINTIKWHVGNIFGKLGIRNRVQAITLARRLGLFD